MQGGNSWPTNNSTSLLAHTASTERDRDRDRDGVKRRRRRANGLTRQRPAHDEEDSFVLVSFSLGGLGEHVESNCFGFAASCRELFQSWSSLETIARSKPLAMMLWALTATRVMEICIHKLSSPKQELKQLIPGKSRHPLDIKHTEGIPSVRYIHLDGQEGPSRSFGSCSLARIHLNYQWSKN